MNIPRIKFVFFFLFFAFAFVLGTTLLLDLSPESIAGPESQTGWKSVVSYTTWRGK